MSSLYTSTQIELANLLSKVKQKSKQDLTFEDWCSALNKLDGSFYGNFPITSITGVDCWRSYYNDGYCPEDALAEDMAYVFKERKDNL